MSTDDGSSTSERRWILYSPYAEPSSHWALDEYGRATQTTTPGRGPSSMQLPVPNALRRRHRLDAARSRYRVSRNDHSASGCAGRRSTTWRKNVSVRNAWWHDLRSVSGGGVRTNRGLCVGKPGSTGICQSAPPLGRSDTKHLSQLVSSRNQHCRPRDCSLTTIYAQTNLL